AGARPHREAGDQAALDEEMRIVPHDLAVLAGTGLGLVGIDHEIARPPVLRFLRHERPLHAGGKAGAAAPALTGGLHLVDERVAAARQDVLGAVPGAARTRAGEAPIMVAVQIPEDAVLVSKHVYRAISSISRLPLPGRPVRLARNAG